MTIKILITTLSTSGNIATDIVEFTDIRDANECLEAVNKAQSSRAGSSYFTQTAIALNK